MLIVQPEVLLRMRQSGFGIGSCLAFAGALALAGAAWSIVHCLTPTQPINHMDFASALIPRVAAIGFAVLIAMMQIVGLALGIAGLRQALGARTAAQIGTVLNSAGVLCVVIVIVLLLDRL